MNKPKNEAGWSAQRIKSVLRLIDRDKADETKPPELTVNAEPVKPKFPTPRQGKGPGRSAMNRPRVTRHDFQLRLTAGGTWEPGDKPGVEQLGPYKTWRGPSRVQRGKRACFLKSGNNTIEAPSWAIMAQRLGLI